MTRHTAEIAQINMEIEIAAPPAQVWTALTESIGEWWPAEFYAGGEAGKRSFALETVPGGRMVETWEGGGGILWGTVICVDPAVLLQVLGSLFPNWGGPSQSYGTWELQPNASGTTLKYSESTVGRVVDSHVDEKDKGWQFLFQTLKAHLEGSPLPTWT
jgi:uncharacterized protein YndB with AHSA1/START domain